MSFILTAVWLKDNLGLTGLPLAGLAQGRPRKRLWPISSLKPPLGVHPAMAGLVPLARFCLELGSNA